MSDGNNDQTTRYCTNCGAEIREGNVFCHVCGASLESTPPQHKQPETSGTTSSPDVGMIRSGISTAFSHLVDWFWSLPALVKLAIAVVVLLVLMIFLSPVMAFICAVAAVACIAFAIYRLRQRGSVRVPLGIGTASVILFFLFIGVSRFIYGGSDEPVTQGGDGPNPGSSQAPEVEDFEYSTPLAEENSGEPVDIYLVEEAQGSLDGAPDGTFAFLPGYVLVSTDEQYYFHINVYGRSQVEGDVGPGDILYFGDREYGIVAGNLDDFTYACSYDSGDPRGAEVAIPEECGFSIENT